MDKFNVVDIEGGLEVEGVFVNSPLHFVFDYWEHFLENMIGGVDVDL